MRLACLVVCIACGSTTPARKKLERAWDSAVNYNPPPFSCQIGLEVMTQRLAAIGC